MKFWYENSQSEWNVETQLGPFHNMKRSLAIVIQYCYREILQHRKFCSLSLEILWNKRRATRRERRRKTKKKLISDAACCGVGDLHCSSRSSTWSGRLSFYLHASATLRLHRRCFLRARWMKAPVPPDPTSLSPPPRFRFCRETAKLCLVSHKNNVLSFLFKDFCRISSKTLFFAYSPVCLIFRHGKKLFILKVKRHVNVSLFVQAGRSSATKVILGFLVLLKSLQTWCTFTYVLTQLSSRYDRKNSWTRLSFFGDHTGYVESSWARISGCEMIHSQTDWIRNNLD